MNNLKIDSDSTSATGRSHKTNIQSTTRPIVIIGAAALFFMFTGLLITTTILIANNRSDQKALALAVELKTAQLQAASIAAASAPAPVADVTRSNAGIANDSQLATTPTEAAMERSFTAAIEEAAVAAQQVTAMEQTFSLPDCVAELQNLVETVRIGFAIGSFEPLPQDMDGARRIASIVADCDPVMVAVEGHSDLTGQEQNNMNLSWIRADAVVSRLRSEGFDVKALEPLGFGARKPIDPSVTPAANALNRRVQFHLAPRPGTNSALFAEN